jgi:hypothetical protein
MSATWHAAPLGGWPPVARVTTAVLRIAERNGIDGDQSCGC